MTNIEKAIQEIEDSVYHESLKPNISTGAKAVALVALHEKLAREQGCEYCLGDDPTPIVNLDINNDDVTEGDISFGFAEPLRFCPMCGKGVKRD